MAVKVNVEALDLIAQLGQEMVVAYEAGDETVATIVAALLNFQLRTPEITVGTISGSYNALKRSIKVDGDTILGALYKLHSTVGGYIHVDNNRELQWEDSIGKDKGQQLRYNKNLKGIERDINYCGLINRLYAYGAGEGTARIKLSDAEGHDQDYVQSQASHDTWGGWYPGSLVDPSITHPDTLLAWANLRLAEIKDPIISYSVNVIDLSESDVVEFSFDELQLGSIIRVIDEDLGIDVSVSVIKITHHDLANPQNMTVELSSRVRDIIDTLMEVYGIQQFRQHIATTIGAGQVIVKGPFTVLDWATGGETTIDGSNIETGTITLSMLNFVPLSSSGETGEIIATINATAEGIKISAAKVDIVAGVQTFKQDGIPTSLNIGDVWFDTDDNNKAYRAACIGADEITAGEWELVRDAQISTNQSAITVNETAIALNVTNITALDGEVTTNTGNITVNANAITLEVTNRTNADSTLQGQITVNAGNITLKVSKNDVINQINISTEGIDIQADNISISGATTFSAGYDPTDKVPDGGAAADVNAGVTTINGGKITTNTIEANTLTSSTMTARTITLSGVSSILKGNYSAGVSGWQIRGDGNAEFNTVTVRGNIQAGAGSSISAGYITGGTITAQTIILSGASSILKSSDYSAGVAGWMIKGDGYAEFNEMTIRGTVSAGQDIRSSNYVAATLGWIIEGSGDAEFNDVTVRGTVYATSGEFTGTLKTSNIEAGKTLTVNGGISVAGGKVILDDNGITVKGEYITLKDPDGNIVGYIGGAAGYTRVSSTVGRDIILFTARDILVTGKIYPSNNNLYDLGSGTKKFKDGYFSGTVYAATGTFTTLGAMSGTSVSVSGAVTAGSVVTGLITKAGNITVNAGDGVNHVIVRCAVLEPYGSGNTGIDIAMSGSYFDKCYVDTYYGKTGTIQSFQGHDDIGLLRSIKAKNGYLDPATFPAEISPPMGKGKGKFVDMLNWQSLLMGAILQLDDRVKQLGVNN